MHVDVEQHGPGGVVAPTAPRAGAAPPPGPEQRRRAVRVALLTILGLNWLVAAAKLVAGWLSGSLSLVADGAHSFFDGGSNVIGLLAVTLAAAKPDREHPYGHQRFEVLGAGAIGVMLALAVWGIVAGALERLRDPRAVEVTLLQVLVLAGTLGVNAMVAAWERRQGERLQSPVLIADAAHTSSDVFATLAVFAALLAGRLGFSWADPVIALGIALYIGWVAVRLVWASANQLADRAALDPERVSAVAAAVPGVRSCHEVRTRGPQGAVFADLRIHVDPDMTVQGAHAVSHLVEAALRREFPGVVDVVVHVEPDDAHSC